MQRSTWGKLITAQLSAAPILSACSPGSPPAPKPTASASAPVSASAPASASASALASASADAGGPGLGAWAPLTDPQPEVLHTPRVFRVAATDRGVLGLVRSRVGEHGCAWNGAADEGCTGFFFAPWKDGKGSPARFPVGAVGAFAPVKVTRSWTWIWPGKQGAYALSTQDKKQILGVLDGQTEQTYEVEGSTVLEQIVETAQGPVALWYAGAVMSAPLTLQDGKATLGTPTRQRVATVHTAREARELVARGQAPAVEWAAIPNINDSGDLDTAFLLTWSEAIPPEHGSERSGVKERRAVIRRGMMCGFSPSRSVDDPSVIKRIMVQRTLRDGKAEGPAREIARGAEDKPAPLLRLEARPKVRERLVGETEQVALPEGLRSAPEQEIVAGGFDLEKKQGVVVLAQAGELVAQVIDEQGKPVGPVSKAGPARPVERRAVFFHDGWIVPANQGKSLVVLTGPRAGTEIKASHDQEPPQGSTLTGSRLVVLKDMARVVTTIDTDPTSYDEHTYLITALLKKDARSIVYSMSSTGLGLATATQVADGGAVAVFEHFVPDPEDPPMHSKLAAARTLIPGNREKAPPPWEPSEEPSIVEVPGDSVLVMRQKRAWDAPPDKLLTAVWLRSGKTIALDGTEEKKASDFVTLTGGPMALPAAPGQAFAATVPAAPARKCVDELVVGPRTRLWLCYKPTGAQGWSHTAGVQVRSL